MTAIRRSTSPRSGLGLQQGELLGLRGDDVDLDAAHLRVPHTPANVKGELTLVEPKTDRRWRTVVSARKLVAPAVLWSRLRCYASGPPTWLTTNATEERGSAAGATWLRRGSSDG